ncbi:hypothetical protein GGR54DRAFT_606944 [Hypoxylon sp. NC1633]|nr:hypothetical protein GGR54DRAFT_606944 [Hypoxylon sp. NC1633]
MKWGKIVTKLGLEIPTIHLNHPTTCEFRVYCRSVKATLRKVNLKSTRLKADRLHLSCFHKMNAFSLKFRTNRRLRVLLSDYIILLQTRIYHIPRLRSARPCRVLILDMTVEHSYISFLWAYWLVVLGQLNTIFRLGNISHLVIEFRYVELRCENISHLDIDRFGRMRRDAGLVLVARRNMMGEMWSIEMDNIFHRVTLHVEFSAKVFSQTGAYGEYLY